MKVKELIALLQKCNPDYEVQLSVPHMNYLDLSHVEADEVEDVVFLESN